MQVWMTIVLAVQLLSALAMIGLVLMQHGKGADMGASFGSGASGSLFGATGSANFLSRTTAVCAAIFFACTLALAMLSNTSMSRKTEGTSVLDKPAAAASAAIPSAANPAAASAPAAPSTPAVNAAIPAPAAPAASK